MKIILITLLIILFGCSTPTTKKGQKEQKEQPSVDLQLRRHEIVRSFSFQGSRLYVMTEDTTNKNIYNRLVEYCGCGTKDIYTIK